MASHGDATTTSPGGWLPGGENAASVRDIFALSIAWSYAEAARAGEIALIEAKEQVLGRGPENDDDPAPRLRFGRQRPGGFRRSEPLVGKALSRVALRIAQRNGGLTIERVGKSTLRVNGRVCDRADVLVGDVIALEGQLVLLVVAREKGWISRAASDPGFAFGEADSNGMVGESPCSWRLRDEIALAARRSAHVLIVGASGTGKELCARAVHTLSDRSSGAFVSRSAATLPGTLLDAELFGNARNYPQAGMPERPGLVGEAGGGTLFLDEIGELPSELQAHLLRLLDHGEYHRLGESSARRSDARFVAATNREESALKHDLVARFSVRVAMPGLDERVEDIPLLIRSFLRQIASRDEIVHDRFVDSASGETRIDPVLIEALLRHTFLTHARELSMLLSTSISESTGTFLTLGPRLRARLSSRGEEPSADDVRDALSRTKGNVSRAAEELGLASRDVLYRLMKKFGVRPER